MTIPKYDPDLNVGKCADGCDDKSCNTDGCRKLFALAPCSTIINDINPANGQPNENCYVMPKDMIFDRNTWCQMNQLNNTTIDLNRTDREKGYLHDCFITTKSGRMRPTVTVDIDYCREDEGHCLLHKASLHGCLVAFMCMEDRADFLENISANLQPDIVYGIARVSSTPISNAFDQEDNRVYTLTIHKYMWMFNTCVSGTALKKLEYRTPEGDKPFDVPPELLTSEQQMLQDSARMGG